MCIMATFGDLFKQLREPGEDGLPDTIYDDIEVAYNDDVSTRDSKIADLVAENETAAGEISRLKSMNYDLMTSAPAAEERESSREDEDDDDIFE